MAAIGASNPPCPPCPVGEVIGTGQLPDELSGDMLDRLRVTRDEDGGLSWYLRAGRGIHAVLKHLASGVDLVPGL